MEQLKPCPFCGSEARGYEVDTDSGHFAVACIKCHVKVDFFFNTLSIAVKAWNTRPQPELVEIKELLTRYKESALKQAQIFEALNTVIHKQSTPAKAQEMDEKELTEFMIQEERNWNDASHYGYLKISQEQIINFLNLRWKKIFGGTYYLYQSVNEIILQKDNFVVFAVYQSREATREEIKKHNLSWSRDGYQITETLNWHERPIETYHKLPPDGVLEKFKICKQRNVFDKFVVADLSMSEKFEPIKDPLLLGKIVGSTGRYLIGQWDDDILVDDLV